MEQAGTARSRLHRQVGRWVSRGGGGDKSACQGIGAIVGIGTILANRRVEISWFDS